jgi:hypothetical protein
MKYLVIAFDFLNLERAGSDDENEDEAEKNRKFHFMGATTHLTIKRIKS